MTWEGMMSKKDDQDLQANISRRNILKTAGIIGAGGAQLLAGNSAAIAASTDGTAETNISGHLWFENKPQTKTKSTS
jgi:hypothetical protein